MPPLTLTNAPFDPFQYPHWPCPMPSSLFNTPIDPDQRHTPIDADAPIDPPWPMPPLTLFKTPIDPDQCPHWPFSMPPLTLPMPPLTLPHWPFSMPPLTLSPCPQCPHWPYTVPPPDFFNWIFNTTIENVQRPDWNFTLKPNWIRPQSDWIRPSPNWIRPKSDWIRPKSDWIRRKSD